MAGDDVINVIVCRHDTLYIIAKSHGTTVEKLLELNPKIKDKNLIYCGDTLKVPVTVFENSDLQTEQFKNLSPVGNDYKECVDTFSYSSPVDTVAISPIDSVGIEKDSLDFAGVALTDSLTAKDVVSQTAEVGSDSTSTVKNEAQVKVRNRNTVKQNEPKTSEEVNNNSKTTQSDSVGTAIADTGIVESIVKKDTVTSKVNIAKNNNEKVQKNCDSNNSGFLKNVGVIALGIVGTYFLAKKGKFAKLFSKKPSSVPAMVPSQSAKNAIADVEAKMAQPTNYRAVSEQYVSKTPTKQEYRAKAAELYSVLHRDKPLKPTVEAQKQVADVEAKMGQPTNYKMTSEQYIAKVSTKEEYNKKLAELREAWGLPKHGKPRHAKKITNLRDYRKYKQIETRKNHLNQSVHVQSA